ncbi:MAG: CcmD family protein [Firmicutes bacterium HGW-Firmicutes-14]|nr:MAG: CcmD family protein [Firmicutes bacterium HGW-Firmicutes-14]
MSYLFAAYLAIWILIFAYTLILGRREKQLQEELFLLKKTVGRNKN